MIAASSVPMARRLKPKDWLHPSFRRAGGSLWPPERDERLQLPEKLEPASDTPPCDPFTAAERRYLCSRLQRLELGPGGLDGPVATLKVGVCLPGSSEPARSLLKRGFLAVMQGKGRPLLVLTVAGKAGVRLLFLRQLADHALLYPNLHQQLGIDVGSKK